MSWVDLLVGSVSTLIGVATLTGIAVRFGLVPYLMERLIEPLEAQLVQIQREVNDTKREVLSVARMFDGHLEQSVKVEDSVYHEIRLTQNQVDRIWKELSK